MKFSIGWFNVIVTLSIVSLFFLNLPNWLFLTLLILGIVTLSTGIVAAIEISTTKSVDRILRERENNSSQN